MVVAVKKNGLTDTQKSNARCQQQNDIWEIWRLIRYITVTFFSSSTTSKYLLPVWYNTDKQFLQHHTIRKFWFSKAWKPKYFIRCVLFCSFTVSNMHIYSELIEL